MRDIWIRKHTRAPFFESVEFVSSHWELLEYETKERTISFNRDAPMRACTMVASFFNHVYVRRWVNVTTNHQFSCDTCAKRFYLAMAKLYP